MDPLTGLDGAFLALETPTTHLHVLGVLVLDPTEVAGGLGVDRVRARVAARLPLVAPFRQRLVPAPFDLGHPALADDPDLDLGYHVRAAAVPAPGGPGELADLVAAVASRPLDRHRPLWEFHVVEGLAGGRVAVVAKVHHAIVDGVAGAGLLAAFFDLEPGAPAVAEGAIRRIGPPAEVPALPGEVEQVRRALGALPGQVDAVARSVGQAARAVRTLVGRERDGPGGPAPRPFDAPRTSVNRAISPHRRVAVGELSLPAARRTAELLGGTVNDVVLAAAAGGMRALFASRGEVVDGPLVALVPVSVRDESDRGVLGNRVTGVLVSLATTVEDPVARFRCIRDGVRRARRDREEVGGELVGSLAQATLPVVASRVSRWVTGLRVFDRVPPVCNVVVSNVPGPDVPLYLAGARLESLVPLGPVAEGVGVNVTVFSYLDRIHVGVQACWDLVPDVGVVVRGMEAAADELSVAAGRRGRPVPWWHTGLPA